MPNVNRRAITNIETTAATAERERRAIWHRNYSGSSGGSCPAVKVLMGAKALTKRRGGPDSGRVLTSKPEVIEHAWFVSKPSMFVLEPRVERSAVETRAELKTKGLAVQGRRFAAHYFHEVSRAAGPKRQVTANAV